MRCPVCDALHLDQSLACEAEATETLKQRHEMILRPQQELATNDKFEERQEAILSSKKQQLKIASRLQHHRTLAHSA